MESGEWGAKPKVQAIQPLGTFFKPATEIKQQGLKVLVWGDSEVGKTHFCMTMPDPVYIVPNVLHQKPAILWCVIDTEFGTVPLLHKFPGKQIFVYEAAVLDETTMEPDALKSLDKIEEALGTLQAVEVGTICIDSGTDVWQWMGAWLEQTAKRRTASGQPYQFEVDIEQRMSDENLSFLLVYFLLLVHKHMGKGKYPVAKHPFASDD